MEKCLTKQQITIETEQKNSEKIFLMIVSCFGNVPETLALLKCDIHHVFPAEFWNSIQESNAPIFPFLFQAMHNRGELLRYLPRIYDKYKSELNSNVAFAPMSYLQLYYLPIFREIPNSEALDITEKIMQYPKRFTPQELRSFSEKAQDAYFIGVIFLAEIKKGMYMKDIDYAQCALPSVLARLDSVEYPPPKYFVQYLKRNGLLTKLLPKKKEVYGISDGLNFGNLN